MPAIPSEEEWLEQTAKAREEADQQQQLEEALEPGSHDAPTHPIAQLQGPFEESIAESTNDSHDDWQVYLDAETRRDWKPTLGERAGQQQVLRKVIAAIGATASR